jgi:hypothetical protein
MSDKESIRACGGLIFTSLALPYEGIYHFIKSNPSEHRSDVGHYDKFITINSVFLVGMAAIGICIGLSYINLKCSNDHVNFIGLIILFSLGICSIGTFTFAQPIYNFDKENGFNPSYPNDHDYSRQQKRVSLIFGSILTLLSMSILTQALQFYFLLKFYCYQLNSISFIRYPFIMNMIFHFFGLFLLVGAIGILIFGIIIRIIFGAQVIHDSFIVDPHYIRYTNITLIAGVIMMVYAFVIYGGIFIGKMFLNAINICCTMTILYYWTTFIMASIGLFEDYMYDGEAGMLAAKFTIMILAPAIIANEYYRYQDNRNDKLTYEMTAATPDNNDLR